MPGGRIKQYIIGVTGAALAGAVFAAGIGWASNRPTPVSTVSRTSPGRLETPGEPPPTGPAASTVSRSAPAADDGCRQSSVVGLTDPSLRGRASLCVTAEGISSSLQAEGLTAGHAYIVQFGYFDRASACATSICGVEDALGDSPAGVLARLDGGVVSTNMAFFGGEVRDLRPSLGAQIMLLLIGNGAASSGHNRARAQQLLMPLSSGLDATSVTPGEGLVGVAGFEFPADPY
jgi:hypothetical protein